MRTLLSAAATSHSPLLVVLAAILAGCAPLPVPEVTQEVILERLFPLPSSVSQAKNAKTIVSPLVDRSQRETRIIVTYANGDIVFLHPESGAILDTLPIAPSSQTRLQISATPVIVGDQLIVVYQQLDQGRRSGYFAAVVDLSQRRVRADFPALELTARVTDADGNGVTFDPSHAYPHAALKHIPKPGGEPGWVYVTFGNAADMQPYHGWVFEIDLDRWQNGDGTGALSAVLNVTPESQCPVQFEYGNKEMICGGGVWTPAGPQVRYGKNGYELLVPTGNGQIDLERRDYANALLKLTPGLVFDPECDSNLCAGFDPSRPSQACLESCKNLFVPRPAANDPPLRPANGECDDKSFWDCLAWMDYDLGANAPVLVELDQGPEVWVQAGKEGGVYLVDAAHLGRQYDRMQIVDICGTPTDPCQFDWRGMIVTQPVVSYSEPDPVVIVPTFISDKTHAAGLIALKIIMRDGRPQFEKFWQFPDPSSPQATQLFRSHPTLPVISKHGDSQQEIVWIANIAKPGRLFGISVKNGSLAATTDLLGTGYPLSTPVIYNDTLYITSNAFGGKQQAWLEAYKIKLKTNQ